MMIRRFAPTCAALACVATAGCTTAGTPVAVQVPPTTISSTSPVTTTTTTTTTVPTTTSTEPPPPKPVSPHSIQVSAGSKLPVSKAYHVSFLQVRSVDEESVVLVAELAPGGQSKVQSYTSNSSVDVSFPSVLLTLGPGSVVSLNNLLLVVDSVKSGHAKLTVGRLH